MSLHDIIFQQYLISRLVGHFRSKTVVITDIRVKLMNEILECVKLIKMYSWEKYFSHKLLGMITIFLINYLMKYISNIFLICITF